MEELSLKFNRILSRVVNPPNSPFRFGAVECVILACHHALRPAGFEVAEHEHPYYGLVQMETGSMETVCDGRRIVSTPRSDTLLFVPQATLHSCRFGADEVNMNLSINFQIGGEQAAKLNARLARLAAACNYQLPLEPGMAALLREIRRQGELEEPLSTAILQHLLPAFLALFFQRCVPGAFEDEDDRELLRSAFREDRAGTVKRLLGAMIRDSNPTGEIARQFGLSTRHLNRIFRRETGMTVKAYQTELRLSSARNLLVGSELSVSETGEAIGFGRPGLFSVFFRRHFGCTPLEYRLRYRGLPQDSRQPGSDDD